MLPVLPRRGGAGRLRLDGFGGLDRRPGAAPGAISEMQNLTGRDAPVLSARPKRTAFATPTAQGNGIIAVGAKVFWADGAALRRGNEGAYASPLPAAGYLPRSFAAMGERLLVWPDKKLYRADAALSAADAAEMLERTVTTFATFADGTYAGADAAGNTILAADPTFDWGAHFRVGDGVTISGAADEENNKTAIVREIEGPALRFYENCFTTNATAARITVARSVPDLDFLCVSDNRVWGCKGDTICCCKLGDPYNWNVFDGLSTDAWSVETGTPGAFTGCVSFMGYPIFFKEDRIFKVYGSRPSNYEVLSTATLGVLAGAHRTLAVAGETLFYLSRAGFVRYNGGYPSAVDAPLNRTYTGGAAGSDGRRYYVSAAWMGTREMLVYDTLTGLWHREDELCVLGAAFAGGKLYALTERVTYDPDEPGAAPAIEHKLEILTGGAGTEADFPSGVTFADFDLGSFESKYPVRLWLRAENEKPLVISLRYVDGLWEVVAVLPAAEKRARAVSVPIRRCDRFGLRIQSYGAWKLYDLAVETRAERKNRKEG